MKIYFSVGLFLFFSLAYKTIAASLPPISNKSLFTTAKDIDLYFAQKKFSGDEDFISDAKADSPVIQKQEEVPARIVIKEYKNTNKENKGSKI